LFIDNVGLSFINKTNTSSTDTLPVNKKIVVDGSYDNKLITHDDIKVIYDSYYHAPLIIRNILLHKSINFSYINDIIKGEMGLRDGFLLASYMTDNEIINFKGISKILLTKKIFKVTDRKLRSKDEIVKLMESLGYNCKCEEDTNTIIYLSKNMVGGATDSPDKVMELSSAPVHDHAYVWLLMKGNSYLPGIFVSVYSILKTKPKADLVVMCTDDVTCQDILLTVATHVVTVPYLEYDTKVLKTEKQQKLYDGWKSVSYTKWNMLALPYKKMLFIDGDTVAVDTMEHLFKLQAPAAPFNSPFTKPLGYLKNIFGKYIDQGVAITPKHIDKMLNTNTILLTANAVLLEPSPNDYKEYIEFLEKETEDEPFGYVNCNSMVDEQSIALFYANKGQSWCNIDQIYNFINWKDGFINKKPVLLHYFGAIKPWNMHPSEYLDVVTWYKYAIMGVNYAEIEPKDIYLLDKNFNDAKELEDTFLSKY
jgi:lipopolysaccharide biosynthesis glycosyltransferase